MAVAEEWLLRLWHTKGDSGGTQHMRGSNRETKKGGASGRQTRANRDHNGKQ